LAAYEIDRCVGEAVAIQQLADGEDAAILMSLGATASAPARVYVSDT